MKQILFLTTNLTFTYKGYVVLSQVIQSKSATMLRFFHFINFQKITCNDNKKQSTWLRPATNQNFFF